MEYLLAYDVGTSGTKAALVTTSGQILAKTQQSYPTHYPQPLWAEQDPADWWQAIVTTTRQLLAESQVPASQILALAFSAQMINLIPVDAQGNPLRPCISWLDGRAYTEARAVMRKLGGPGIFSSIIGSVLTGKDLLPKYLWLKQNEPEIYTRAAAFVDASGYVLSRATGRLVHEWGSASVTGLFNLKSKIWDGTLISLFGLERSKFAELVRSTDCVGGLLPAAAAELGLLGGTRVFGGSGDAMTAAIGSGAVGEGEGHLCLGTSGFVGVITARRLTGRQGIVTIQSGDPSKLLLIGEMETAGECLKWTARELYGQQPGAEVFASMDQAVAATEPGAGGLLFTPWMYGERCPLPDERLRAAFINLGANHNQAQMTRAVYEGVAFNLRWVLNLFAQKYRFPLDRLRVIGGGALSQPWLQIIADVTGRRLEIMPDPQEASAIGAALIAAVGLGIYPTIESTRSLLQPERVVGPNPATFPEYERLFAAFTRIHRSLRGLYQGLNKSEAED